MDRPLSFLYLAVLNFLFHTEILIRYRKSTLYLKKTQELKNHLHHEAKLITWSFFINNILQTKSIMLYLAHE